MSSIGSIMGSALSSLQASQLELAVASNNIANANNLRYTRQRVMTSPTVDLLGTGGGIGVQVTGIEAVRNDFIERRLRQEDSSKAGAETLSRLLGQLEPFFGDLDGAGLQEYISSFFNSFQSLSTNPTSSSLREIVRTSGETLADAFKRTREDLFRMQRSADSSVSDLANRINSLSSQIAHVTAQIQETGTGGEANTLIDQRNSLVRDLASIAEVHVIESGDQYQVTIGSNRLLVLQNTAIPLTTAADASGFTRVYSGIDDITSEITQGELSAHIQARDNYIPSYLTALDDLAYNIVEEVNSRHAGGYDLDGNTGVNFFNPVAAPDGAAASMALSAAVEGNLNRIAASSDSSGVDNQNAIQIGNLSFEQVLGSGSLTDQYANLVFKLGTDVSNAETALREHEALATQLEARRQAVSGVSLDEESVQVLQFQRAYEASARLITTVDEILKTLLGIGA